MGLELFFLFNFSCPIQDLKCGARCDTELCPSVTNKIRILNKEWLLNLFTQWTINDVIGKDPLERFTVSEGLSMASFTWKDLSEAFQKTRGLFKGSYTVSSINGSQLYSSWTEITA